MHVCMRVQVPEILCVPFICAYSQQYKSIQIIRSSCACGQVFRKGENVSLEIVAIFDTFSTLAVGITQPGKFCRSGVPLPASCIHVLQTVS